MPNPELKSIILNVADLAECIRELACMIPTNGDDFIISRLTSVCTRALAVSSEAGAQLDA